MTRLKMHVVRAASVPALSWSPCLLLDAYSATANIRLPSIFSEHMVLQAEMAVPAWGWADRNETLRVSIAGQIHKTQADSQGHGRVTLEPLPTGPYTSLVVQGTHRQTVHDVLIGDSIKNGYAPYVTESLQGKVNVAHLVAFGMIGKKDADAEAFCAKFKDSDYALIHYNDGLHSLPPRITDEQFGVGLTAMLKHLKTVTPRVIWATTTPAPDLANSLGPESQNEMIITRNAMSKQIAAKFNIPVNDLYELVIGDREQLQKFGNVHFTPEGSAKMGKQIAALILDALETK
jgi:hypothetical protein